MFLEMEFWTSVDASGGTDSCWDWKLGKGRRGYGLLLWRGKHSAKAHRVAYELVAGPIPDDHSVLHSCDNPSCCNPRHLRTGTNQHNVLDTVLRDRRRPKLGTESSQAKMTDEQVVEIATRYASGGAKQRDLAKEYSISQAAVSHIILGKSWPHVKRPIVQTNKSPRFPASKEAEREILADYLSGNWNRTDVARRHNVSVETVKRLVRRHTEAQPGAGGL